MESISDEAVDLAATSAVHMAEVAANVAAKAQQRMPQSLTRLERLVRIDSGADASAGREEVAGLLGRWAQEAGCEVELQSGSSGSTLVATLYGGGGPRVVLLGHHDTVFPIRTGDERGLSVHGGRALGPGVADMKGGLLLGLTALDALAAGERRFARIDLLSVPDEESRPDGAFEALERASGADVCLVLECSRENGDLVYERKAHANLAVSAVGRGAHAGTHPERGRSALLAMCREALRLDGLNSLRPGLTITIGTMRAGTHFAVVPERAEATVDLRAWADADIAWALEQVRSTDGHEGVSFDFQRLSRWPSMAPTPESLFLLGVAEHLGRQLGTPVGRRRTGGSSDGCWTASAGIPTLDGLGPIGGHDHSPEEYIDLDSWPARCGLLAGVITAAGDACAHSSGSTSTADEGDDA